MIQFIHFIYEFCSCVDLDMDKLHYLVEQFHKIDRRFAAEITKWAFKKKNSKIS